MLSDPHGQMICPTSTLCVRLPVIVIMNPVNKFCLQDPNDGTNKEKFFFRRLVEGVNQASTKTLHLEFPVAKQNKV